MNETGQPTFRGASINRKPIRLVEKIKTICIFFLKYKMIFPHSITFSVPLGMRNLDKERVKVNVERGRGEGYVTPPMMYLPSACPEFLCAWQP